MQQPKPRPMNSFTLKIFFCVLFLINSFDSAAYQDTSDLSDDFLLRSDTAVFNEIDSKWKSYNDWLDFIKDPKDKLILSKRAVEYFKSVQMYQAVIEVSSDAYVLSNKINSEEFQVYFGSELVLSLSYQIWDMVYYKQQRGVYFGKMSNHRYLYDNFLTLFDHVMEQQLKKKDSIQSLEKLYLAKGFFYNSKSMYDEASMNLELYFSSASQKGVPIDMYCLTRLVLINRYILNQDYIENKYRALIEEAIEKQNLTPQDWCNYYQYLSAVKCNEANWEEAIDPLLKCLEISKKNKLIHTQIRTHELISLCYSNVGNNELALKHLAVSNKIRGQYNDLTWGLFLSKFKLKKERNFLHLKYSNAEKEIKFKSEQSKNRIILIIVISILFGTSILLMYQISQKRKIKLRFMEAEARRIMENLSEQESSLMKLALLLDQKDNMLIKFGLKLKKIQRLRNLDNIKKELNGLTQSLSTRNLLEHDVKTYKETIKFLNKRLQNKLLDLNDELTKNEINLIVLIGIGYSSKEIALFKDVDFKSIEVARYRLRKKLNLEKGESLKGYIQKVGVI